MEKITIGILAHVDAGKTTLSEAMLYLSGSISKPGRVDKGTAYLDTHELEKRRGITIFSGQAVFSIAQKQFTLLDTPGHTDFSAEMERTLQVLDYAILVISGSDGIQGHTLTLWKLLARYQIPVFLFINKMDQPGTDRRALLKELQQQFGENCIDFSSDCDPLVWAESVAMCGEDLLEQYLETNEIQPWQLVLPIARREIFPCYFGSALKLDGVDSLLNGLQLYTRMPQAPDAFGARVFKISRDPQGNRLTHMKITGGTLKVKAQLSDQKINQIRLYSGQKYETADTVDAGTVCAVTGLTHTRPGEGLGTEAGVVRPILEPVLTYRMQFPEGCRIHQFLPRLHELEEEEPELHLEWKEETGELYVQVMGEVQLEILKSLIEERLDVPVTFDTGKILYKETILDPVIGVGHFEPLRHYAEVHLLLEPDEPGSGLTFASSLSEDDLDRNWQRLILSSLREQEHPGVLTGAPITDMKITLLAGRAHLEHTEGGDFRQAACRAVRQGLSKAHSVLLEPWYDFRLEVPMDLVGRAMTDIQKRKGRSEPPIIENDTAILIGSAPVSQMRNYQREVSIYSGGKGHLFCSQKGYEPCQNQEEIIEAAGYQAERDTEHPTGSVFCAHGAGFQVPWYQVESYMHIPFTRDLSPASSEGPEAADPPSETEKKPVDEEELKAIFERTYGRGSGTKPASYKHKVSAKAPVGTAKPRKGKQLKQYLLVDGYNIIFAWDDLKELADDNLGAARDKLMDILSDYQGSCGCEVILVFDAYKVQGGTGSVQKYHNIYVVYTKEAETADQYIERTAHEIGHNYDVTVATSDGLEQVIIRGQGCRLLSARELGEEIVRSRRQALEQSANFKQPSDKIYLLDEQKADDEQKKD